MYSSLGAQVLAISCDSAYTLLSWSNTPREKGGLGPLLIPLVSDYSKNISKNYDVLVSDGQPLRATFIIDSRGIIRHTSVNDLTVGRNVEETIRLIRAFQHADSHGEACPAGWEPGSRALVEDSALARAYFESISSSAPPLPLRWQVRRAAHRSVALAQNGLQGLVDIFNDLVGSKIHRFSYKHR